MPPVQILTQISGDATLEIAPAEGGRIRSLRVRGIELLRTAGASELDWGCFPMAPWTGRVRHGRFSFGGRAHRLPFRLGPHAIHGTVMDRPWRVVDAHTMEIELGDAWPFPGRARQEIHLSDGRLDLRLTVQATEEPMPASCGWHPWFLRRLSDGEPARVSLDAGYMLLRDEDNISSTTQVAVPPGPWDDCFGDVQWPVVITWPGAVELRIASACRYVVVFDEREEGLCVEPCTGPPDALNTAVETVVPGYALVAECSWNWRLLG